jgi:hypothetical protein
VSCDVSSNDRNTEYINDAWGVLWVLGSSSLHVV